MEEEEYYVLTPKGMALVALMDIIPRHYFETFWTTFTNLLEKGGYHIIQEGGEDSENSDEL